MDALIAAIRTTPVIDHHCHNLLLPEEHSTQSLLSITSEANGLALQHAPSTLAHMRAVKQLADILNCEPTWDVVRARLEEKRTQGGDAWVTRCMQGLETLLIDDGLDEETVHGYGWHDRFTPSRCKRIVRIEPLVEGIIKKAVVMYRHATPQPSGELLKAKVEEQFRLDIEAAISDSDVVGFKSVICYRTGLALRGGVYASVQKFQDLFARDEAEGSFRLEDDQLGPYFVHLAANIIMDHLLLGRSTAPKPLQFHTGYGDNDLDLQLANPCHLREFIEMHPGLPIVLLHGSYPFTKEAGYLASVYENVYLDLSLVFPCVSADGQAAVIRQALELCPTEKLLWSTDGHWFPETYLLAVMQVREALEEVLVQYVEKNALTATQATSLVHNLLFHNANRLYNLGLSMPTQKSLVPRPMPPQKTLVPHPAQPDAKKNDKTLLTRFLDANPGVKYIRLQIIDYTATPRARILPVEQMLRLVSENKFVGITKAIFGLLQNDTIIDGFEPVGEYNLHPCFESLRLGERDGYATVQCEFRERDGEEVSLCPRTVLRKPVERAKAALGTEFLVGFEMEVIFMSCTTRGGKFSYGEIPVTQGHAWSTARAMQGDIMDVVEKIVEKMGQAGIVVQQFHPESAPGQFEFITDPLPPVQAVDTLLAAKEIIQAVASKHSLRATFYPVPFPGEAGTGAHIHISMSPSARYESFYAGVLNELQAISAFTFPNSASYERVQDGNWSGGTYVAWGTQNRETPLRKIEDSHWEIKCMDGLANPYLALAAILATGVEAMLNETPLSLKDCEHVPLKFSDAQRKSLGIHRRMPSNLDESLRHLKERQIVRVPILGSGVIETYISVKKAEAEMLAAMAPDARRSWLIERY